jgi:hypothetical protein
MTLIKKRVHSITSKEVSLFAEEDEGWRSSSQSLGISMTNDDIVILIFWIYLRIFGLRQWNPDQSVSDILTINQTTVRILNLGPISKMTNSAIQGTA